MQFPFDVIQTYGPYWIVGGGYTSTIYVRNRSAQDALSGTIILYVPNGAQLKTVNVTVAPNAVARVSLGKFVETGGEVTVWGGLAISFPNRNVAEVSQVIVENQKLGIIYDLKCSSGNRFDAHNELYAPWWLPDDGTNGKVALFNSSDQSMTVSPSVIVDGAEVAAPLVNLASHETRVLSLRDMLRNAGSEAEEGAVLLRYSGPPHSLIPALLLANAKTGFSLVPEFIGRMYQVALTKTTWWYPSLFFSGKRELGFRSNWKLTAYALLSNGTGKLLGAWISAYVNSASGGPAREIKLPIALEILIRYA